MVSSATLRVLEYGALKTEIGGKEADKSVLEDEILRTMTTYEEMQQRYKSFEKVILLVEETPLA